VSDLGTLLRQRPVLGLRTHEGMPTKPDGPALAVRIRLDAEEAMVQISASNPGDDNWKPVGKAHVMMERGPSEPRSAAEVADALARELLSRLVVTRLLAGPKTKGKPTYQITIVNASPLILNGLALAAVDGKSDEPPLVLAGFSLPPMKDLIIMAAGTLAERLALKKGRVGVVAADLSGL
jgi:hypothetical protein